MIKFDYLNFFFSFIERIKDGGCIFCHFSNGSICKIRVFLFIKDDISFSGKQINDLIMIGSSFLIDCPISDERLCGCGCRVEYKEVEIISLFFSDDDEEEVIIDA